MMLIVDSGSTKAHWCVIEKGEIINELYSIGINPYYQTRDEIYKSISDLFHESKITTCIKFVFFYGAGCAFDDKKIIVSTVLQDIFSSAEVSVESDLLGAAISIFGTSRGIACILGTGSNSCLYDGKSIISNVSPLGYILGDEGSGAVLGKNLVADCLKNQLPEKIRTEFLQTFKLDTSIILDKIYKQPFPNRFLAQFSPFILSHLNEPEIYNLVYNSFDAFIKRNVINYDIENQNIGFTGSISYYFKEVLIIVCKNNGIRIVSITQSPMRGLQKFHSNN
jgi:N-acetylglucosamine kinase-like BadF-type ATPase